MQNNPASKLYRISVRARRKSGLGHEPSWEMKSLSACAQWGVFWGAPHQHLPALMGSISCTALPGCGAIPAQGLSISCAKPWVWDTLRRDAEDICKLGDDRAAASETAPLPLGKRRAPGPLLQSWGRMDKQMDR